MSARTITCLALASTLYVTGLVLPLYNPATAASEQTGVSKNWLLDVDSDEERFRLLQDYLGGFSQNMREVGFRYRYVYLSIVDGNFELADYHWKKIKNAIEYGFMKRPARRKHSEDKFLNDAWQQLSTSLKNEDAEQIRADFRRARKACMECHKAEDVGFLNDQGLFRDTAEFPKL